MNPYASPAISEHQYAQVPHSGVGIASFAISCVAWGWALGVYLLSISAVAPLLVPMLMVLACIAGFILGGIGVAEPKRKRIYGVLGLAGNAAYIMFGILMYSLGGMP